MQILLSGATGLVGGALTGRLLDEGHQIYALVRGSGRRVLDLNGDDRIEELCLLSGDITQVEWGLESQPQHIDRIIHCAATTDFVATDDHYARVNVGGTENALALAKRYNAPLLHVSTAYVCGQVDGAVMEQPANLSRDFTNGYERSKAMAEMRVMSAVAQGLTATIARPSIIVGRLHDGAIPRQDDFYNFFRLFGSPLLGQLPASKNAALAIVPICHVVDGLQAMAENIKNFSGQAVHLVADKPFPISEMLDIISGFPRASAANIVDPQAYDPASLDRRQALVHRKIGAQFFEYFRRIPLFSSDILRDKAGIAAPGMDRAALMRMIDHCHQTGFLDWQ